MTDDNEFQAWTGQMVVGCAVRLVVPDNPRIHGAIGRVRQLAPWGAYVATTAAATGEFRAAWWEMVPPDWKVEEILESQMALAGAETVIETNLLPSTSSPAVAQPSHVKPVIGAKPVSRGVKPKLPPLDASPPPHTSPHQIQPKRAREEGYTGDVCDTCGSLKVKRNGPCLLCTECGTSGGCG